jgi:acyl-coenzyme A thioesterase PaaI-like protein
VTYIAEDWKEVHVKIPLSWRTRNYVGTIYGGSMYGAIDPIYMLMLIKILGPEYIVWDKAAKIRFRKPGKDTLFARFHLSNEEIVEIKRLAEAEKSVDRNYSLELKDKAGIVHAEIEKTLYIAKKGSK